MIMAAGEIKSTELRRRPSIIICVSIMYFSHSHYVCLKDRKGELGERS